jgi:hypothetical protein
VICAPLSSARFANVGRVHARHVQSVDDLAADALEALAH